MTVVVIALVGGSALAQAVSAASATGAQVLVGHVDGRITDVDGRTLGVSAERSVPMRRQAAAALANGSYVAFLEDTVLPERGWLTAVEAAFRHPDVAAVGGPVGIDPGLPARYRALGWTEYGRFQNASLEAAMPTTSLPGCNFAFRTDELRELLAKATSGLIDQEIFTAYLAKGRTLAFAADMRVIYGVKHDEGVRLAGRFAHGRIYASRRRGGAGPQLSAAIKAIAVPPVLFLRQYAQMRRAGTLDLGALPWMAAMDGAWGAGEFTGALLGLGRNGLADWN